VEEGKLTVRVELPGIDPKDITVNVVGDMLTIRALRQAEHETKKRDFLHSELRRCHRTLDEPSAGREGRGHQGKLQQ
jgi:HSP20 family molecular chaperone IbpA